jgi:hypothetical protein
MRVVLLAHIGIIYQRTHYSFVDDLSIQGTVTQSCQGFLISFVDDLSIQGTITQLSRIFFINIQLFIC